MITPVTTFAETEESEEIVYTGLAYMPSEHWQEFNSQLSHIVNIYPNQIALSRLQDDSEIELMYSETLTPVPMGQEFVLDNNTTGDGLNVGGATVFPLASSVDVSESNTFPAIGNQGSYESCVAWSLAYYQLTNNNCTVRGLSAKQNTNIMSPRWVYNLVNMGRNVATYYDEACAAIMSYGCASISDFSNSFSNSSIKSWSKDEDVWLNALYNKPQNIVYEWIDTIDSPIQTPDAEILNDIKKILSNGYVVTFPTYFNSFVYTTSTTNGESSIKYMKDSQQGGHAMTIVGYDDNFWTDVNSNGKKDAGEMGAFKVANSHGTSYKNDGYVWLCYDALNYDSSVSNAPTNRQPALDCYYFLQPQKEYTPLLVAEVQIESANRDQIQIELGISSENETTPEYQKESVDNYNIAFNNAKDGFLHKYDGYNSMNINFSGGRGSETATIVFDVTPLFQQNYINSNELLKNVSKNIYVRLTDSVDDQYTTKLKDVKIYEPTSNKEISCLDTNTVIANDSTIEKTTICTLSPIILRQNDYIFTLTFSGKPLGESVNDDSIYVIDKKNNKIEIDYVITDNQIQLIPIQGIYEYNTSYELFIQPTVKSIGHNSLINAQQEYIYFLGDYKMW